MEKTTFWPILSWPRTDIGWIAGYLPRITKPHPEPSQDQLLRLAETSPHLLRDIGFSLNSDGTWSNGRHRVMPAATRHSDRLRVWGMRV